MRIPLLAIALIAAPAIAQESPSDAESADTIAPKTFTVPGASQQVAYGFARAMQLEQRAQDYCWEYGCLVIVNETANYDITGFFIALPDNGKPTRWGPNQFGQRLYPKRATYRFKTGEQATCDLPVRFILRQRQTRQVSEVQTRTSLCKSPKLDTLVRIRMLNPSVTVTDP